MHQTLKNIGISTLFGLCAAGAADVFVLDYTISETAYDLLTGARDPEYLDAYQNTDPVYFSETQCWNTGFDLRNYDIREFDLENGVVVPATCYTAAVQYSRPHALTAIETAFVAVETPAEDIRRIKDEALLKLAEYPKFDQIDLALSHGADLYAVNEEGKNTIDLIKESRRSFNLETWALLYGLYDKHGLDEAVLYEEQPYVREWFENHFYNFKEEQALTVLEQMHGLGMDLTALANPDTGKNLLHIAIEQRSWELLKYIYETDISFSLTDFNGRHALDYASAYFRGDLERGLRMSRDTEAVEHISAERVAYALQDCDYNFGYSGQDLSDDKMADGAVIPPDCTGDIFKYQRPNALAALERSLYEAEYTQTQIDEFKQDAFFDSIVHSISLEKLTFGLSAGIDIGAVSAQGQKITDIILGPNAREDDIGVWEKLYYLHDNYGLDLSAVPDQTPRIWTWFKNRYHSYREEQALKVLEQMRSAGMDITALRDPDTGYNLLHLAAEKSAVEILKFIHDRDIRFNTVDHNGRHVLDYAPEYKRQDLERAFRLKRSVMQTGHIPAESAAYALLSCELDLGFGGADITPDDLAEGITVPLSCLEKAFSGQRSNAIQVIEHSLTEYGYAEEEIQDLKNTAFLKANDNWPRMEKIKFGLDAGAALYAVNEEGKTIADILIAEDESGKKMEVWDNLYDLHKEYGLDFSAVPDQMPRVRAWFLEELTTHKEEKAIQILEQIQDAGMDVLDITDPQTGRTLLHAAAEKEMLGLLKYIFDHDFAFAPVDHNGTHFLDLLPPAGRSAVQAAYGADDAEGLELSLSERIKTHFENHNGTRLKNYGERGDLERMISPEADFSMYGPIQYDSAAIPDNGIDPTLIISEYAMLSFDFGSHIRNTTRVALGVGEATGSENWDDVISIELNPQTYGHNDLTSFLLFNTGDYVVLSHSIGNGLDPEKTAAEIYQDRSTLFDPDAFKNLDQWRFVYYNAAGNDNREEANCLTVDDVSFCMQNPAPAYHPLSAVRVGAASLHSDGTIRVEDYSNMRPAFCALLPTDQGALYAGTSFTSPAAATIEERLADIFARSAALPDGAVHQDILMALMLTAEPANLVDQKTGETVPLYQNSAGLPMNDRCGAGVIHEQRAADLLSQMIEWTRNDPAIEPTQGFTDHLEIEADDGERDGDHYIYRITAAQDGIITQIRALIPFEEDDKGAAFLQIGDADPVPFDLAYSGLTTEFRFAGHRISQGDEIKIITTRPLNKTDWKGQTRDGFLDLRMVQTNSPISRAIESTVPSVPTQ